MKCKCFSADMGYHREDCSVYDTFGKLKSRTLGKILSFEEIKKLNPSRSNPIQLESSKLKDEYQDLIKSDSWNKENSFPSLYHKITVIGTKDENSEIVIINGLGKEDFLYCNGEGGSSFHYDKIA